MRNSILFYLNGKRLEIYGSSAFEPLSTYLRSSRHMTGTKVVCDQGACGACTVLVGFPRGGALQYKSMNACLLSVHQVSGCHVVTVEGLSRDSSFSPVQEALIAGHGAQCGFCTPGMVMTLTGLCEGQSLPCQMPSAQLTDALCGNLCRCTGYLPILESASLIDPATYMPLSRLYSEAGIAPELEIQWQEPTEIEAGERRLFIPVSLSEAARKKQEYPDAVVVAGATELGVQWKKADRTPQTLISLAAIMACAEVRFEDNALVIDAGADWTQIEEVARVHFPQMSDLLRRFAGPQIKNAGTLGGQIVSSSPIGDVLPLLHVLDAQIELVSSEGHREIGMEGIGSLANDELVSRVFLPLPRQGQRLHLEKVSRRAGFDRSIVSAAMLVTVTDGRIDRVKLAYGGLAATVQRLRGTEEFLAGKMLTEDTLREAGQVLQSEISPVSDARGSREYRSLLAANLLLRMLDDDTGESE